MIESLGTKLVPLTEELAQEFATMPGVGGERPLKNWRVEFLKSRLAAGLFHSPKWAVVWFNGKKYRINGQHSSNMLAASNGDFPHGLKAVIDEFKCETEQEQAELFQQFDPSTSIRNREEIINAHRAAEHSLAEVSTRLAKDACDGVGFYVELTDGQRLGKEDRARLTHTHQDFILWLDSIRRDAALRLSSVSGAAYATWLKDPAAATEFWRLVHEESAPENTHPTRVLSKWLRELRAAKASNSGSATKRHSARSIYERCIHCWNAYRSGRSMKHLVAQTGSKKGAIIKPV